MSKLKFCDAANYKIIVKGEVRGNIIPLLPLTTVIGVDADGDGVQSSISLKVKDQAQLTGILNALYDHHYVILKVENFEPESLGT